ncbi:MAG: SRPBCC domain-containing protein [Sphingobacteriales bacterium]|nr:MAG: SRPBCC domain-containing protein [Sphingobacteriales bacterium]
MIATNETAITKDAANKKMIVTRKFDAPVENVWRAWTEASLLDQWWAPRPWKAETKSMNFSVGGQWLYCMAGPAGEKHWACIDYEQIVENDHFIGIDAFCDEQGNKSSDMPPMHWRVSFSPDSNSTQVRVDITFETEADMDKIIEMGFKEGFTMAHGNLDELLAKQ